MPDLSLFAFDSSKKKSYFKVKTKKGREVNIVFESAFDIEELKRKYPEAEIKLVEKRNI